MPFCRKCKSYKLEMDMTFNDLCKVCFITNENNYWNLKSKEGIKTKRKKGLIS